jgi:vacuolar-type H+-ATPase subunit H
MSGFSNNTKTGELWGLVSLMSEPKKYRQKLSEMLELEIRLDEKIAKAGVADQIVAIRANVARNHDEAIVKLTHAEQVLAQKEGEAHTRAAQIIEQAHEKIAQLEHAAQHAIAQAKEHAHSLVEAAKTQAAKIKTLLDDERAAFNAKAQSLNQTHQEINRQKDELTGSIARQMQLEAQAKAALEQAIASKQKAIDEEAAHLQAHRELVNAFDAAISQYLSNKTG